MSSIYTKPKAIAFERMAHCKFEDKEVSFERCDTDGFLSQWASGLNGQLLLMQAQIAEDEGYSMFPSLYDTDLDVTLNAHLVESQYGMCWVLSDYEAELYQRRFVPFAGYCTYCDNPDHQYKRGPKKGQCKKCKGTGRGNSRVQKQMGLVEKDIMKPAHAVIEGKGTGIGGSAWVQIVEVSEVYEIYKPE